MPRTAPQITAHSTLAERYAHACRMLSLAERVGDPDILPVWAEDGKAFCFVRNGVDGRRFFLVDLVAGLPRVAFDHDRLATALANHIELCDFDWKTAPVVKLTCGSNADGSIEIAMLDTAHRGAARRVDVAYSRDGDRLSIAVAAHNPEHAYSPDGRHYAFVRDFDLFVVEAGSGREHRLTDDGEVDHAYATLPDAVTTKVYNRVRGIPEPPQVLWSPDSRRILTYRMDQRGVLPMPLIQHIVDGEDAPRPRVHLPKLHTPGDAHVATGELMVFDVTTGDRRVLDSRPLMMAYSLLDTGAVAGGFATWRYATKLAWWNDDGSRIFFLREERGYAEYRLMVADPESGATRVVVTETRGEGRYVQPAINRYPPVVHIREQADEILVFSQRDGWGHIYRYRLSGSDDLLGQVTHGNWNVADIVHVDGAGRIFLNALGRDAGQDPYCSFLLRVDPDGAVAVLTPESADHRITMSPDGSHFVDVFSTVAEPPVAVVRRCDGSEVSRFSALDLSTLQDAGWTWPERFAVTGEDGETRLYGVLYRPAHWVPGKRYPILDDTYGSQSMCHSTWRFHLSPCQALADLGFYVVTIDGRSTPLRSRSFRDTFDYRGASGLADHVPAIQELAKRHLEIDLDRVGVYGNSGGGYSASRAVLEFPDFFKVAVASCGNNDQRLYSLQVGERYLGMPDDLPDIYFEQATKRLAANLKGHLLLIHGMLDETVNPVISFQLAQALIEEGKRFDMMLFPNEGHSLRGAYLRNLVWNYFTTHFLGETLPFSSEPTI